MESGNANMITAVASPDTFVFTKTIGTLVGLRQLP